MCFVAGLFFNGKWYIKWIYAVWRFNKSYHCSLFGYILWQNAHLITCLTCELIDLFTCVIFMHVYLKLSVIVGIWLIIPVNYSCDLVFDVWRMNYLCLNVLFYDIKKLINISSFVFITYIDTCQMMYLITLFTISSFVQFSINSFRWVSNNSL